MVRKAFIALGCAFAFGACAAGAPGGHADASPEANAPAVGQSAPAPVSEAAAPVSAQEASPSVSIRMWQGGCDYASGCGNESFTLIAGGTHAYERADRPQGGARAASNHSGVLGAEAFVNAAAALRDGGYVSLLQQMSGSGDNWRPDDPWCMSHGPGVRITRVNAEGGSREVF